MKNNPFISVIVCTFNGEKHIKDCLDALVKQKYPQNKYEIIVVDDGSTDATAEVVSKYNIKLIMHTTNLGISSGRNSGIQYSKGEIIVYTDDDCIPRKTWLKELIKPYEDNKVMGVGGLTIPFATNTYTEKFMFESGYGNPAPIAFGKSKNPLYRFFIYLLDMFKPVTTSNDIIQVQDIYTLNASFKKKYLEAIHGFDKNLKSSEDVDICSRLNKKFNNKIIVFNSKAIVLHRFRTSYIFYLKQIFERSANTLSFYRKNNKIPPIFPFPILLVLCVSIIAYLNLFWSLLSIIILPLFLYSWWIIRFIKQHKADYFIFPYMQLGVESFTMLGMLRKFVLIQVEKIK